MPKHETVRQNLIPEQRPCQYDQFRFKDIMALPRLKLRLKTKRQLLRGSKISAQIDDCVWDK